MKNAYNFNLPEIRSGTFYQLKEFIGKVVILTFWTSWCPDCQRDLPKKEHLFQTLDSSKVVMITINVKGREREFDEAVRFHNKHINQLTLVDDNVETYRKYDAQGVPATVIIDQDGRIVKQLSDQSEFIEIVEALGRII
ncbi:TlpA disulfide reductase family protein [Halobacillus sp. A5]|uniref:TlpA family protein disulfide reductase n=1 Tax=Halobacillus sp. A5 TaxID=2880263 RepID=UPI0020A662F5|nr:TlpA disulfide reductase family protein [Halobacillus sp. A5]MCP3028244.1 TlpA family protein disulfide reductase [Halobacillus sp. A5]